MRLRTGLRLSHRLLARLLLDLLGCQLLQLLLGLLLSLLPRLLLQLLFGLLLSLLWRLLPRLLLQLLLGLQLRLLARLLLSLLRRLLPRLLLQLLLGLQRLLARLLLSLLLRLVPRLLLDLFAGLLLRRSARLGTGYRRRHGDGSADHRHQTSACHVASFPLNSIHLPSASRRGPAINRTGEPSPRFADSTGARPAPKFTRKNAVPRLIKPHLTLARQHEAGLDGYHCREASRYAIRIK